MCFLTCQNGDKSAVPAEPRVCPSGWRARSPGGGGQAVQAGPEGLGVLKAMMAIN